MSGSLKPYLISEFTTGLSSYLEPWIRPKDAFDPLVNAYTYRGVLTKRNGSKQFGNTLSDNNPVMGIMNFTNESTGAVSLVVASTRNLYLYDAGANTFTAQTTVGGPFWTGTATGTLTLDTQWDNITPSSVTISDGTNNLTFDAAGAMNSAAAGIFAALSSINYTTGVVTINITGTTANVVLTLAATVAAGYFTGNITNFFNWVSWQATVTTTASTYLYMTNNVDPVTLYDGTNLSRPILYTNSAHTSYITRALDIAIFQNRLLILRPALINNTNSSNQDIYFSALFSPLNFITDVAGNGGNVTAATGDIIQSQEFLRNNMIVFFTNSVWNFRFTGSASDPFRFDKLSIAKSVSCPYASVAFDERCTAIGNLGLIACDGTNVQRYDTSIIDYYETEMSVQYFGQAFSQRYDNLNQSWTLYVSQNTINPLVSGVAPGSDRALIYNFAENSWATYTFSQPMTCLGKFFAVSGKTWAQFTQPWEDADATWNSYGQQKLAPILLGGDTTGHVYWMDQVDSVTDFGTTEINGTTFLPDISTTRWNPVIAAGQKTSFPYIDIYYSKASVDTLDPIVLTLSFYVNDSDNPARVLPLTLDGPVNSGFAWKRIYCNVDGQFLKMNIDPDEDSDFEILGFIIWAQPSGRMTPGGLG